MTSPARAARLRSLVAPTLAAAVALALLVGLGVWQLHRLQWKLGILQQIESRTTAPPAPLPPRADWATLRPDDYAYRHVTVTGTFDHTKESHVFRPLAPEDAHGGISGVGDLVLTPLRLADGSTVIVNRGFVPDERLDPATRAAGQVQGPVTVTGLMREPEGRNLFTPADNPARNAWFTRDPKAMAAWWHLQDVAPFTIDADRSAVPGGLPQGGVTMLDIPNNHLSYAMTWFGLAGGLACVYVAFVWRLQDVFHSARCSPSQYQLRNAERPSRMAEGLEWHADCCQVGMKVEVMQ